MNRSRGAATIGGVYAGALLGSIAGFLEAVMLLDGQNLSSTPGSSFLFVLLSVSLYAVVVAAAGVVVGFVASFLPYLNRKDAGGRYGYPFAVSFGAIVGGFLFVLGTWWVRMAPPDIALLRRYVRTDTLVVLLLSIVVGRVAFHVVRRISRLERVERYFASRWSRTWTFVKLGAALVLLLVVVGFGGGPAEGAATGDPGRYNVVLITIDTLRANHLEHQGYDKPTSPLTRVMSRDSVVFRECVAQYPLTTPSHASILSGRYVRSHGAVANAVPIHDSVVLLSEVLKEHGYTTGAFITSPIIGEKYGFDRGYDHFVERNRGDFTKSTQAEWMGQLRINRFWYRLRRLDRTTVAAENWLASGPETPFFLWLHYITPHAPYAPPHAYEREWDTYRSKVVPSIRELARVNRREIEVTDDDVDHIVALYDAEVHFTEDLVARVLSALDRIGARDNTLIVFTADHGESLFDRSNYFGHGQYLYDEEVLVPLFFHCPARLPVQRMIDEPVETIHIAPTILDFLDLPPEPSFQGMSLMNVIDPGSREWAPGAADGGGAEDAAGETEGGPTTASGHVQHPAEEKPAFSINRDGRMIRFRGWKYIEIDDELGTEELYDLGSDPGETNNLVLTETEKAAELRELLRQWNASVPVVRSDSYELDDESVRALRALGYVD